MTSKVEMVSVVIPTLNEAGTIKAAIDTIDKYVMYPKEIIIVDSNSTDGTIEIVKDTNLCRLIIEPRRGYGIALRTGIKNERQHHYHGGCGWNLRVQTHRPPHKPHA